jgi:hypothetical protein
MACGLAACMSAQEDPRDLLLRVRDKLMEAVDRLPKYLCTQTIDRKQFEPDDGVQKTSCDQLLGKRKKPGWKMHLVASDRLRLDVAVTVGNEMYSWAGENRFADSDLVDMVNHGAISTGSFGSFLMMIFEGDQANFSYNGETIVDGRTLVEFGFRTPVEKSHYYYGSRRRRVQTGYDGTFLADPKTLDLVRLVVRSDELPPETGICEATSTLTYGRVRLNDADFLLPSETRLLIVSPAGVENENRTVYTACREFRGESTVKFESQDVVQPKAAAERVSTVPPGLPFTVALTQNIDTSTAAAGDAITAELITPIRDLSSKILAPKGATVMGRILRIQRYYQPERDWTLTIRLETLDMGGTLVPLSARSGSEPDPTGPRPPFRSRPMELGTLSDLEQIGSAAFEFRRSVENLVIKRGLKSNWVTLAPR